MINAQIQLPNKQVNYQTSIVKVFATRLVIILSLTLGLTTNSCFAKINVSNLERKPHSQLGGNLGGIFFDKNTTKEYYVKFYSNEMQAHSEFLANKIYAAFGVSVPKAYIKIMKDPESKKEKLAYITKWENNLEFTCNENADCTKRTIGVGEQLAKIHLISALVRNDDTGFHNTLFRENKVFVIDAGDSFKFGPTGQAREYGSEAINFCSFVDGQRKHAAKIFSSPFKEYTLKNTDSLIAWLNDNWQDDEIKVLIEKSKIEDREMIFTNLKLRFEDIKTQLQELKKDHTLCQ